MNIGSPENVGNTNLLCYILPAIYYDTIFLKIKRAVNLNLALIKIIYSTIILLSNNICSKRNNHARSVLYFHTLCGLTIDHLTIFIPVLLYCS